ncbi:MBL fold metallo-hydrolase [Cohnella soli]|uniref:MBL fold metallo-hydrolase n=1 Tax=Cohnella soli TaxID=425005 RepID=A0ABW0HL30_9BACL
MEGTTRPLKDWLAAESEADDCRWMWLGQGSFVFRFGRDATIWIDPYLSDAVERELGLTRICLRLSSPDEIAGDIVAITHDHADHFDPETIECAVSAGMRIAGPSSCLRHYREMGLPEKRYLELDRGQMQSIGGVRITAVPAHHPSGNDSTYDSVGYVLEWRSLSLYIAGDTEWTEEVANAVRGLRPDAAFVPINGQWGNMNAYDASLLVQTAEAKRAIPMHFGMFAENDADPQQFADYVRELSLTCKVEVPVLHQGASFSA